MTNATTRRPTPKERLLAQVSQQANIETEEVNQEVSEDRSMSAGVLVTHKTKGMVVIYHPVTWGWESVKVPIPSLASCLNRGFTVECGDCGGNCSPDPMNPTPNACPGRAKFATRRCPKCTKLIYDFDARNIHPVALENQVLGRDTEEADIQDDSYERATPASRTKAKLDEHILAYHPSDATVYGIGGADPRLVNPARSQAEAVENFR